MSTSVCTCLTNSGLLKFSSAFRPPRPLAWVPIGRLLRAPSCSSWIHASQVVVKPQVGSVGAANLLRRRCNCRAGGWRFVRRQSPAFEHILVVNSTEVDTLNGIDGRLPSFRP